MQEIVVIEPAAVRKTTAGKMLDCSLTKIYELLRAGKLRTIKVGADDRVVVKSIREYVDAGGDAG